MDRLAKTRMLIVAFGISMLLAVRACNSGYVEYQPIKRQTGEPNKLVPAPELNNSDHFGRVTTVLDFYREKWQTNANGKLLIPRKLAKDKELLWNYTKKAEDRQFLERSKPIE